MFLGLEQSGWDPSVLCHLLLTKSIVSKCHYQINTLPFALENSEVSFCLSHVVTALFNIEESVVFELKEACLPLRTATSPGKWSGLLLCMPSFVLPVDSLAPFSLCWNESSCVTVLVHQTGLKHKSPQLHSCQKCVSPKHTSFWKQIQYPQLFIDSFGGD